MHLQSYAIVTPSDDYPVTYEYLVIQSFFRNSSGLRTRFTRLEAGGTPSPRKSAIHQASIGQGALTDI
jgi:hypothetical protein